MIIIKLDAAIKTLEFIGKGTQGEVYKINNERCIKIFKSKKACSKELKSLLIAQNDMHFPRFYEAGKNYIIREYIEGIALNEYLGNHKLTPQISKKLIDLYDAMTKVGYLRKDTAIFHILVTPLEELKLIDTSKAMSKKTTIPSLLISGLENLGYKEDFFYFLKSNKPDYYVKWQHYSRKKYKKM